MRGEQLTLPGCAPTPLASYLKALGVLRLISSPANHVSGDAADPNARGWWEDECFHLRTTLHRDALLHFFLHEYAPSPIIAPWNGGSGFYPKDNKDGFKALAQGEIADRFTHIASVMRDSARIVERFNLNESPKGATKVEFVASLRSEISDGALSWLDAVLALSGDGLAYPELLGTGGNDGRLDFTNNYARRLVSRQKPVGLFDAYSGQPRDGVSHLLEDSLLKRPVLGMYSAAIGQFAPGAAGGPNATNDYSGDAKVNAWDFVLMLEGATAFAGTATRRYQHASRSGTGATTRSGASFPFTVRAVGAGWGGLGTTDENDARAEFWAPIWTRPTRAVEIDSLLGEGRAVLNDRTVKDGLDFARAVGSLGVSRGFRQFQRFGFFMRFGMTYLAAPIGRRSAAPAIGARLVADLDAGGWLDSVRGVARRKEAPGAARRAIKRLEDALFALSSAKDATREAQRSLVALGDVGVWLARSVHGRGATGRPPPILSAAWVRTADDGSAEFRIAAALASLGLSCLIEGVSEFSDTKDNALLSKDSNDHLPMAAHFASINEKKFFYRNQLSKYRAWNETDMSRTQVWSAGPLVPNLIAVLERRLVEAMIRSMEDKPLSGFGAARLVDVAAFLSGDFDDDLCAQFLAGLIWARPTRLRRVSVPISTLVPFAYTSIKPLFVSDVALRRIGVLPPAAKMPIPPGLIARLRAAVGSRSGQAIDNAVHLAFARARASGLPTPFAAGRSAGHQTGAGRMGAGVRADRLAAALLIPIHDQALNALIKRAYPGTLLEDDDVITEDISNDDRLDYS